MTAPEHAPTYADGYWAGRLAAVPTLPDLTAAIQSVMASLPAARWITMGRHQAIAEGIARAVHGLLADGSLAEPGPSRPSVEGPALVVLALVGSLVDQMSSVSPGADDFLVDRDWAEALIQAAQDLRS